MAYRVPTLDEMQSFLTAFFKALFPNRNIGSRFSFYWKLIRTIAGAVTDVHAHVDASGRDVMPDTTSGATQDRWLKIVGTERKGATPARKSNAGRLVGTSGSAFTTGAVLFHRPSGQTFQVNETGTMPVAGFIDVDILAISVGSATRLRKKEILEFTPPLAGIATNVELQLDLDEDGTDAELDGAAQVRLLSTLGNPQSGGNQADFVRWVLAPKINDIVNPVNVLAGYCYPNRAGIGSVDIAAFHAGTGSARFLNSGERGSLLLYLQQLAPSQVGGIGGALRVLTTVGETANVEMTIQSNGLPLYAFDWDDAVVPTVLLWTAATRTLQLAAPRPTTMKAGDRICIFGVAVSGSQDCAPIVIESLVGADTVVLQTVPKKPDGTDATPVATDKVYAGGPLTATVRDAVIAHINSDVLYAGPNGPLPGQVAASQGISTTRLQLLLDGIGTSNPAGKYGSWSGALRTAALNMIAGYTRGVRTSTVITPVADQESTDYAFPNDTQIGAFAVGFVLVRKG